MRPEKRTQIACSRKRKIFTQIYPIFDATITSVSNCRSSVGADICHSIDAFRSEAVSTLFISDAVDGTAYRIFADRRRNFFVWCRKIILENECVCHVRVDVSVVLCLLCECTVRYEMKFIGQWYSFVEWNFVVCSSLTMRRVSEARIDDGAYGQLIRCTCCHLRLSNSTIVSHNNQQWSYYSSDILWKDEVLVAGNNLFRDFYYNFSGCLLCKNKCKCEKWCYRSESTQNLHTPAPALRYNRSETYGDGVCIFVQCTHSQLQVKPKIYFQLKYYCTMHNQMGRTRIKFRSRLIPYVNLSKM